MSASGATMQRALGYEQPINALVCGASGGIGLALVDALLAMPQVALVIAASRHASASLALAARSQRWPGRLLINDLDIGDESSLAEATRQIGAQVGALHLTINCVGALHNGPSLQPEKRLADVTREALLESFSVNACGAVLLLKHLQPLLPTRERAVFASLSARVGSVGENRLGGWYAYRASKAAQNMLLRTAAIELRRRHKHLTCVALHPGTVATQLSAPFTASVPDERLFSPQQCAGYLLDVIASLTPDDTGSFIAWDGQPIAW